MNLRLLLTAVLAWTTQAGADCVADGPLATARWIYTNDRDFAFQQTARDLSERSTYLSPSLLGLLLADWRCQVAEQGVCALDADPWVNAQDGEELPPIDFFLASTESTKVTVMMTFRFGWHDTDTPAPVPASASLVLYRDAESECWQLDDLIGPKDISLKQRLKDYPHDA
jgi:hypothetical protein